MPDRNFIAERRAVTDGWLHSLREANHEAREVIGYALEDKILERTPLRNVETAMLFTYMHRRFGLPNLGGDDYKDLSAAWLLTTPASELALIVQPSFSGPGFSFRPVICVPHGRRHAASEIVGDRLVSLAEAYERTLLDLLRPVIQRDHDFNALGEISDLNPVPDWAEDDDNDDRLPRYHETCGLPMPDGLFGNGHWERFITLLARAGRGDYGAGMGAFIASAEKEALASMAGAREELRSLVAGGLLMSRMENATQLVAELGASPDDLHVVEFCRAAHGNGPGSSASDWFMQLTEADIADATQHVAAFGADTRMMETAWKGVARMQRLKVEWSRFLEITKGQFDETLVPDVPFISTSAVDEWRRNLAAVGDPDVSIWAEAASRDDLGQEVLGQILSHLHACKLKAGENAAPPQA